MPLAFQIILLIIIFVFGITSGINICLTRLKKQARYKFTSSIFIHHYKITGDNLMTKVPLNAASVDIVFGSPVDAKSNEAKVQEGSLLIQSTDDSILTVGPSETQPDNPYAIGVTFTGKTGAAQVTIKADADLGEEIKEITGQETFEISAGEAVGFSNSVLGEFQLKN